MPVSCACAKSLGTNVRMKEAVEKSASLYRNGAASVNAASEQRRLVVAEVAKLQTAEFSRIQLRPRLAVLVAAADKIHQPVVEIR